MSTDLYHLYGGWGGILSVAFWGGMCLFSAHFLLDDICSSLATWPLVALGVGSINGFIEVIPRSHFYHLYLVTVTNEVLNVGVVSSVLFVLPSVSICLSDFCITITKGSVSYSVLIIVVVVVVVVLVAILSLV